ncbi:MAG: FHA domain-containing protein [Cycloclasticus sp.]|nr:FHA domain-containing protein [Cycloclasticus sp.]MBQ0789667.1 FHA domain-containing protein [Cycloclasticus sp.]
MAKLTLFFNNKPIDVFHLENTVSTIGRDPSSTFLIDSLAVAPMQLKISRHSDGYIIENMSDQYPCAVNKGALVRQQITSGEKITLGKHQLLFSDSATALTTDDKTNNTFSEPSPPSLNKKAKQKTGYIQVIDGPNIGLVTVLNKAITEINTANKTSALIAKRQFGYYISRLADDTDITVDGASIYSETKLDHNCSVSIGNNDYTFFIE